MTLTRTEKVIMNNVLPTNCFIMGMNLCLLGYICSALPLCQSASYTKHHSDLWLLSLHGQCIDLYITHMQKTLILYCTSKLIFCTLIWTSTFIDLSIWYHYSIPNLTGSIRCTQLSQHHLYTSSAYAQCV